MDSDNILMELVQSGDKQSFDELVTKHRVKAIAFANSFVHNLQTSEDIVQECFIKIYLYRDSYKPTHTFKTFLFTLIRNKAIDDIRKKKPTELTGQEMSSSKTLEELYIDKEQRQIVFEILGGLQKDYKTALYLYAVENMSYSEIAKTMNKTIPQIKILIYRARKKLKTNYERVDDNENK